MGARTKRSSPDLEGDDENMTHLLSTNVTRTVSDRWREHCRKKGIKQATGLRLLVLRELGIVAEDV